MSFYLERVLEDDFRKRDTSFIKLAAKDRDAAVKEAIKLGDDWETKLINEIGLDIDDEGMINDTVSDLIYGDTSLGDTKVLNLYEMTRSENLMPLVRAYLADIEQAQSRLHDIRRENEERKQYEALKAKFEKKEETANV